MSTHQPREKVNGTLPAELLARLDNAVVRMSERAGCQLSRSQVIEAAIARGLPALEGNEVSP